MFIKKKYLGNILFFQEKKYQFTLKELKILEVIITQISLTIDYHQIKEENYYLKEENTCFKSVEISHELRSPVAAIVGFSNMLLREIYGTLNLKQKDYLQRISDSGEYLLSLVNDILDIAKINAKKEEIILSNINIKNLCEDVMIIIEEEAKSKNLKLILEIDNSIKNIKVDQRRIKQILMNLLSNGVKFTSKGSITLKVYSEHNHILFSVIDTGIGIDKNEQIKLFQPFQQISSNVYQNSINQSNKSNKSKKGTGLGLALSQKLAHLHGGKIICESELNQGSCFTLYLPLK